MKNSKLLTPAVLAFVLCTAASAHDVNAANDEVVQNAGGVSYVSGGVGTTSIERLSSLTRDFNLKLVFAMSSGDYVSDVKITIANGAGKTLVDATSEGPWFLTKLPAGKYLVAATFADKVERRTISVGAEKLVTVDFRWTTE